LDCLTIGVHAIDRGLFSGTILPPQLTTGLARRERPTDSQRSADLFCRSAVRSDRQEKAADLQNRSALPAPNASCVRSVSSRHGREKCDSKHMASRRKSREYAMQMLYQWELGGNTPEQVGTS